MSTERPKIPPKQYDLSQLRKLETEIIDAINKKKASQHRDERE